ncbi:hypothetical protein [Roseicyclus sp.]
MAIVLVGILFALQIGASPAERRDIPYPYVEDDIAGVLLRGIVSDLDTYHAVRDFAELVRSRAERRPENRFPMLLLSIGRDSIIGGMGNPDYLSIFPTNVPEVLATIPVEGAECNIESITGSNGALLLWVSVDSDINAKRGVRFAEHCILAAVALSLGTDLLDLSGITTNDVISLILATIE